MSQYTTDKVLQMMEDWYEEHGNNDVIFLPPSFSDFNDLLGADLSGIDLSEETINAKAEEWKERNSTDEEPPWQSPSGGLNLSGALISSETGQASLGRANLQGADLSWANLQGADLSGANLQKADLRDAKLQKADLRDANLQGGILRNANLEGADLSGANLKCAELSSTSFEGAYLRWANLHGTVLYRANLHAAFLLYVKLDEARLEDVTWNGNYLLGEELNRRYSDAETVYRNLKQYYSGTGQYDIAGEFHRREMIMRRKKLWRESRFAAKLDAAAHMLFQVIAGYGERPSWVLYWSLFFLFGFAFFYLPYIGFDLSLAGVAAFFPQFGKALYFSTVSFTNLGYGGWVETGGIAPSGWTRYLGAVESVFGIFLVTLFLVTFVRKMSRS